MGQSLGNTLTSQTIRPREKVAEEIRKTLVALQQRKGLVSGWRGLLLRWRRKGREEGSGLHDFLGRHQVRELVAAVGARGVTCGERSRIPSVCSHVIEWQAFPLLVQISQVCFRAWQSLSCGKP